MRVGIYGTARNEAANLRAWLDSTAGADCVVLNDTGSTDDTYALAQADPRVIASQLPVEPMLLCNALTIAMRQLPDDIDLAIRLDLDERLQPGWREKLERLTIDGPTVFQPWFDHHGCTYRHDRIHTPGFRWELPVHEILTHDGPYQRVPVEVTIEHHQDLTKDRSQVLGELEDAVRADPDNMRMLHYYGRERFYRGEWDQAISLLCQHANSAAFIEERAESFIIIGDCRAALGCDPTYDYERAAVTAPHRREPWVKLAAAHRLAGRWPECLVTAETALRITERCFYFNHPAAWGAQPYDEAALACWNLGRVNEAREYGTRSCELAPDDERLVSNLRYYEGASRSSDFEMCGLEAS